jgi:hypothetical protein
MRNLASKNRTPLAQTMAAKKNGRSRRRPSRSRQRPEGEREEGQVSVLVIDPVAEETKMQNANRGG